MIRTLIICLILVGCSHQRETQETNAKKQQAISKLVKNDLTYYTVEQAMAENDLKGLSVAVFENYKLVWTETWGVKDVKSKESLDENTAFSTASIAKPITAVLIVMLEEKGLISLDDPVSKYLKRWQLPESEFLKDTKLTLKHLLSHTAGTTQHGFADFYSGDTIPTIVQSLKGELPNYDEEIDFNWKPGTSWGYSGGGYVIAQMAVEDELGATLSDLADEHLFKPLGLNNTTLKQPNEEGFKLINLAKAHDEDGYIVGNGIPITPQVAASGLWSTPTDLSTFLIEMQNALRNRNNKVISQKVAEKVTKIVTTKVLGGWSLGWERRYGYGNNEWFSHGGANTGVGGHVYATLQGGNGIVVLGNSANQNRLPVIDKLRESIIINHNWHIPLDKSFQKSLSPDVTELITGNYTHAIFPENMEIVYENDKLLVIPPSFPGASNNELIYIGNNSFIVDGYPSKIIFEEDQENNTMLLKMNRNSTSAIETQYIKQ
jgi:CubicO group peptidase (beta-lactamase class C family)